MYTKLSAGAALVVVAAFVASGPASAGRTAAHQRNLPLVATSTLQYTLSVEGNIAVPPHTGTGSVTSSPAGIDCGPASRLRGRVRQRHVGDAHRYRRLRLGLHGLVGRRLLGHGHVPGDPDRRHGRGRHVRESGAARAVG